MHKIRAAPAVLATVALSVSLVQTTGASVSLARPNFNDPAWSPDGRQIAFTSNQTDPTRFFPDVWLMNADGSNMRRLTDGPADCPNDPCGRGHPSWSPDGKRLAYQAFAWIDVINSNGTGHRRLWVKGNEAIGACCPAWSPGAGRRIAFTVGGEGVPAQLWVMNADGSGKKRLARAPDGFAYTFPTWSPAGRWIAFSLIREPHPPKYGNATGVLGILRSDGKGRIRRLKAGSAPWMPAWSHDGRRIVSDALKQIAVVNVETGKLVRLRAGQKPFWSPNDRRIVYEGPRGGIFVMNANGAHVRRLTPTNF